MSTEKAPCPTPNADLDRRIELAVERAFAKHDKKEIFREGHWVKYLPAVGMIIAVLGFLIYNRYEIEQNSHHRTDKEIHRSNAETREIVSNGVNTFRDQFMELITNQKLMSRQLDQLANDFAEFKKTVK